MPEASSKETGSETGIRLAALRAELARRGLDGFVVPHADEHQGEYVAPASERLAWLTGFTGSAGAAVVLAERAAVFADGRYTLQVRDQVDTACFAVQHLVEEPPETWIEANLGAGGKLGYDPWLHSERQTLRLRKAAKAAGAELVAVEDNPIDALWSERPAPPSAPITAHPLEYAGRASADKRADLAKELTGKGAAAAVLTLPDSIAWLLNVRGGDVPHTPLPLSFALLRADATVDWFVAPEKLTPGLEVHLGNGVIARRADELGPALDALGAAGERVLVDPESAAAWVFARLRAAGAEVLEGPDPCRLPKARKNAVELDGARAAHKRDGLALTRFLAWLDREAPARARSDPLGEVEAAERLRGFREQSDWFRDLSFDTIAGAGANGAIVHYRAREETQGRLKLGELFLLDSGAQYPDGTTDVTRTLAIGEPSAEMRDRFTRVLKGHIALATARFPRGTTGSQLDALARVHLWRAGLDYDHGTGHGVGSYLSVHEGPQRISKVPNRTPLEPGMIVSNEPGYYKAGAYGIRIENLVAVIESEVMEEGRGGSGAEDGRAMLAFETLTLAPIDLNLVEPGLLSAEETAWLDAYHARVRDAHRSALDQDAAQWLERATRPLGG
ncbi:MAG: aminopeptidase P family protein [Proteobacteria bacterium]|nr:aminopeptidase P family protein [Pseudomonadota bacterium]